LLTCPQRLKGAIDSRIAEEQARQKSAAAAGAPVSRSASTVRRSTSRTESPSSRPRRKPKDNEVNTARGPDPSEFENAFVIEDESEEPSRVGTPAIGEEKPATMVEGNATAEAGASGESSEKAPEKAVEASPKASELSPEVRTKLRKLEKLESKYQGRVGCGPDWVDSTDKFRTPTILPNCTCTSHINRTIREGIEGTYPSGDNWRS
jgi:hypothetical protein